MEERIETKVVPETVWASWERAHEKYGQSQIIAGQKGTSKSEGSKGFRYQVLDVIPGQKFTILWKTIFVRLLFSHSVIPTKRGSEICYGVQIKGLFAWPVRWFLGKKIQKNINLVLRAIVKQLEEESVVASRNW